VLGAAMVEAGLGGIGRLTLSRRERVVMVEPRGTPASADAPLDVTIIGLFRPLALPVLIRVYPATVCAR
jgi:hypothetical protein